MFDKRAPISEAYKTLGLEEGTSLETVKSTYRQLALKTHPDKNPNNKDATVQFQELSQAYNVLLKHLDSSTSPLRRPHFNPFGMNSDEDEDTSFDGDYYFYGDCEDDYYSEELREAFARFIFEQMLRDKSSWFSQRNFFRAHPHMYRPPPETPEEYEARLRRERENREAAAMRRQREQEYRKATQAEERAKERKEAEKRQKDKATRKRVEADASSKVAEQKVRIQQERYQTLRSGVFAAAREGDAKEVQRGIWENSVDAAGGEVKLGCDTFVKTKPADLRETLAHIAAGRGDTNLFEWLDTHGADLEGRNSDGLTPFHIALRRGRLGTLRYLLETYPPVDSMGMYISPPYTTLLSLALESGEPEALWIVLENKLAEKNELEQTRAYITSERGRAAIRAALEIQRAGEKLEELTNLLASFGSFSLNPEARGSAIPAGNESVTSGTQDYLNSSEGKWTSPVDVSRSTTPRSGTTRSTSSPGPHDPHQPQNNNGYLNGQQGSRDRGRGRGRGHGRGRSVFRGRDKSTTS